MAPAAAIPASGARLARREAPSRAGRAAHGSTAHVEREGGREKARSYVERALVLWPRLDRGRLRRIKDDPARIAAFVERRTSQPFEAILAMLTREVAALGASAAAGPARRKSGGDGRRTREGRRAGEAPEPLYVVRIEPDEAVEAELELA